MKDIYLDYQATTPMAPEVHDAMLSQGYANPHSAHKMGRKSAAAIEVARDQINELMPDGDIIFTSGATEALNLAILGTLPSIDKARNKIIVLPSEHAAVLDVCAHIEKYGLIGDDGVHRRYEIKQASLQANGLVDMQNLSEQIDGQCALVIAMQVNNEIGVIQPIEAIAGLAHAHGALMLCDMVQGFGRIDTAPNIDVAALSSHKIYGPKGIGALWMSKGVIVNSISHGGGQEKGLRSGTLSPALCTGFGMAAHLMRINHEKDAQHIIEIKEAIMPIIADWTINGDIERRYGGNLNMRMDGLDVARLMSDLRHLSFSAGSACASGSGRTSHVLKAIALSDAQAKNSIRLGFGRYSDKEEIIEAVKAIDRAAKAQISEM